MEDALRVCPALLKFLSVENCNNRRYMSAAIRSDHNSIHFMPEALRDDVSFALEICHHQPRLWEYMSARVKTCQAVCFVALSGDGNLLARMDANIRNNWECVLTAIRSSDTALSFASDRLRKHADFVLQAISIRPAAIKCASDTLRHDVTFIGRALAISASIFPYLDYIYVPYPMIEAAIVAIPENFMYAPAFCRADRKLVLKTVRTNGQMLQYASSQLRESRDVCEAAINQDRKAVLHMLPRLYLPPNKLSWWKRTGPLQIKFLLRHKLPDEVIEVHFLPFWHMY